MAHALEPAADGDILRAHPRLSFRSGRYSYQIVRERGLSVYSVSDGVREIREPILWAFGKGEAGQTYVFQHDGSYYQSRVSFFKDVQGLDITLGAPRKDPESLDRAAGDAMTAWEARLCFGCHATAAVSGLHLQVENLIPGITCEGCHGPGGEHVSTIEAVNLESLKMFNPGTLSTGDLADFCGSCHRSSVQVQLMRVQGVENVRFQPYRLSKSRCYDRDDHRISCLACHNPHQERNRDAGFYDAKCLECHQSRSGAIPTGDQKKAACPVGTDRCVTCHMPKCELPGGHFKFTDHWIRVVKRNEAYPG